jgi:MutS domain V
MPNPKEIFENRVLFFQNIENELKIKANRWTLIRASTFVITLVISILASKYYSNGTSIITFLIGFAMFLYAVSKHLKIVNSINEANIFKKVNQNEINRLNNNFEGLYDGIIFSDRDHNYSSDLDLFGQHSLYQLVNRSHTFEGNALLANWMKKSAPKGEIEERQSAAIELSEDIEFRQSLEVQASISEKISMPITTLFNWLALPQSAIIVKPIYRFVIYLPIITILVLFGAILGLYSFYFVGLFYLINGILLKTVDKEVSQALDQTEIAIEVLKPYKKLLQLIENKPFKHKKLLDLQAKVANSPTAVANLQTIIHQLSYRSNPAFALTGGVLMLWDIRYFIKLKQWQKTYKNELIGWIAVVSEFEALNSLAGFQFANPSYAFPVVSNTPNVMIAKDLGHPLINFSKRVYNDFEINGIGSAVILTGSNMSGKSTFERTVGLNLVLAQMGAVVCAASFTSAQLQLFTSMRTQDSLENDTSSFYAELKRLEKLIKLTNNSNMAFPIFYLIDEVLKGTNSKDRHAGAKALILQLSEKNSVGIISTHDVGLGDEFEGNSFIKNYSFSSEMIGNELVFDYKLRAGVCHSFNATELMRKIGIDMPS